MKSDIKGKKILVVGLGLQGGGIGLTKYLIKHGANVTVTDLKTENELSSSIKQLRDYNVNYSLGRHKKEDFISADIIFKGPSVHWNLPEIIEAEKRGILIEDEISFFIERCPAKIVGITGTRGKSTTTHLIYKVLLSKFKNVYLGGNIKGLSTIELLEKTKKSDIVVLELSSFQLSGLHRKKISPNIAIFTNFYPDHLNYYKTFNEYFYDKKAIYLYQKKEDIFIANKSLKKLIEFNENTVIFSEKDFLDKLKFLKGKHNLENAAAALRVAKVFGINSTVAKKIICNFKGLPFRQQIIIKKNNLTVINDTTSTTPTATIKAIETYNNKLIYLILGGNSKNLPFDDLINKLKKVKKIILLKGSFTNEILTVLKKRFPKKISEVFDDLNKAIKYAYKLTLSENKEAYLLFSPGATSFSMFKNEFDRGEKFNQIIKKITNNE